MNLKLLLPTYRARAQFVVTTLRGLKASGPGGGAPRVLDVGCGEADLHPELCTFASTLAGCDVHPGDVERARARVSAAAGEHYRVADAARLPWEKECFDIVLCLEAIEHVGDVRAMLGEAARVLRPGGTLVLTCPNANFPITYDPLHWLVGRPLLPVGAYGYGHTWLPSEADVCGALEEAGFVGVEVAGLTGWLAAGAEAYWAGLAQRWVKRNAGNDGGHGRPGGAAHAGARAAGGPVRVQRPPTVGLAFTATKRA